MKSRRLAVLLVVMVVVPLVVLGWFARSTMLEQQAQVRSQFMALLQQRVDQSSQAVGLVLEGVQQDLRTSLQSVTEPQELQALGAHHPLTRCGFWLDAQGQRLFPDTTLPLSQEEQAFVERTRSVWTGKAQLDMSGGEEVSVKAKSDARKETTPSLVLLGRTREDGWIPWFWEDGLHLLYWTHGPQGSLLGVEVDRIALLSRIVAGLPEQDPGHGAFFLLDESGRTLHRFGNPALVANEPALAERDLPAPLQGWKLAYHGPREAWESAFVKGERLALLLKLAGVGLLLILAALWFWRESTRSLREARQRVDFVNQVSHELKTPLTNIRLYAELLEDEVEDPGQAEKLRVIRSESERLSRMILNILTFSRRERRKLTLSRQPVDLGELAREVIANFSLSMEKRGIQAHCSGSATRLVNLDRDAAAQIIANLLSNAEKYAAQGKEVHVTLQQGPTWTELEVIDNGAGIPWELRERIFAPFYRVSNQLSEGVSGTGIGLNIARALAEMMDGTLQLAPSKQGARFLWRIRA